MSARGFTLAEIVVTIFIALLMLSGVSFFFRDITDALISTEADARLASDAAGFPEAYRELRARYPTPFYQTGAQLSASKTAFGLIAFQAASGSGLLVVGAEDSRTEAVALGTNLNYAPYVPFLVEIASASGSAFQADPMSWLAANLPNIGNPYSQLEVSRFAPNVLSGSVVRLDLDVVEPPNPYSYDQISLRQFVAGSGFDSFPISIVR